MKAVRWRVTSAYEAGGTRGSERAERSPMPPKNRFTGLIWLGRSGMTEVGAVSARCKVCRRHRCGRCGWSGRRKVGVQLPCSRCGHVTTTHAVMHRNDYCSLADSLAKHKRYECRWCGRIRRDDRMRRWDGQMECREVHACGRAQKERMRDVG